MYDPSIGRWHCSDPLAEAAPDWSPYRYGYNNPISYTDPTGMLETNFEDEDGNLLLRTLDGSDDVVTVGKQDEEAFKAGVARAFETNTDVNTTEWSENWKGNLESGWLLGATYSSLGKEFAQGAYMDYLNDPSMSNWLTSCAAASGSRWATPEILVGNMSAGIAAYGTIPNKVYRLYGGDSKADGYSWTPTNPNNVSNFRDAAGLPSGGASGYNNTGRFVIEGTVENRNIILTRPALPLDGNRGGLKEFIINPSNVNIRRVSGVNPQL